MVTWLDSLSLTSAPINHRLRYRALCAIRARMFTSHALTQLPAGSPERSALIRACQQLESMHRYADQYLRLR